MTIEITFRKLVHVERNKRRDVGQDFVSFHALSVGHSVLYGIWFLRHGPLPVYTHKGYTHGLLLRIVSHVDFHYWIHEHIG